MTNVQSYEFQRQLSTLRSLACRVVFLADVILQGSISYDDNLDFNVVEEQLSACSCSLIDCVYKIYFDG